MLYFPSYFTHILVKRQEVPGGIRTYFFFAANLS